MERVKDLTDNELLDAVREAAVVIGLDVDSKREHIFFGRDVLGQAASGRQMSLPTLRLSFNRHTDEMERLAAACRVVKGKDDYGDGNRHLPSVN